MTSGFSRRTFASLLSGAVCAAFGRPALASDVNAVDETYYLRLGGIGQWNNVRGDDRRNPVLLVVHGGPGEAQSIFASHYRPWEKHFTVVQWDQRGAGHTYGRYGEQTPDVNLERISKDGIELVENVSRGLDKRKIVVLGHSWGSTVAIHMVQARPDLFAAYVGTGQVASWKASVQMQFDAILRHARASGDTATLTQLETIGQPDPANAKQYFAFTKNLMAAMAPADRDWLKALRAAAASPEMLNITAEELKNLGDGMNFTAQRVLPDQMKVDLPATARRIDTAFFVIQGEDDVITPTRAAVDYFNMVTAPQKELVLIPGAGHFAYLTAGGAFLAALIDKVRPAAIARGA